MSLDWSCVTSCSVTMPVPLPSRRDGTSRRRDGRRVGRHITHPLTVLPSVFLLRLVTEFLGPSHALYRGVPSRRSGQTRRRSPPTPPTPLKAAALKIPRAAAAADRRRTMRASPPTERSNTPPPPRPALPVALPCPASDLSPPRRRQLFPGARPRFHE